MSSEGNQKIGAGHAGAMGRLGLRELRSSFYPDSNVAQHSEYGLYGTLTPGEVAEGRRADDLDQEQENSRGSIVDDRLQQGKDGDDRDDPGKDIDLE
jgi:hypothetical protein